MTACSDFRVHTWSIALTGLYGRPVKIEVARSLDPTAPDEIVTLGDVPAIESVERVRAALTRCGHPWPAGRIVVTGPPARTPPSFGFDLALACAVAAAAGRLPVGGLDATVLIGELAGGRLPWIRGVLPALFAARRAGARTAVIPLENLDEAALVDGLTVVGAEHLSEVLSWVRGERDLPGPTSALKASASTGGPPARDLADLPADHPGRFPLEVAAAGGHHVLFLGPVGSGATRLAQQLPGLLPDLEPQEALRVFALGSLAGRPLGGGPPSRVAPFIDPHHSVSRAMLIGGGPGPVRPGAVSRANSGVLFLDELAEFHHTMVDDLVTALDNGEVRFATACGTVCFPARCQLVLASPGCPCRLSPPDEHCVCSAPARRRYRQRLSGRLLDRIDLRVRLHPPTVSGSEPGEEPGENTASVRRRVTEARITATARWAPHDWRTNAEVPGPVLRERYPLGHAVELLLDDQIRLGTLTTRGVAGVLRVAWTLADLADQNRPDEDSVQQALALRAGFAA